MLLRAARFLAVDMSIDPELVERFRADLHALRHADDGKLGVAYSGGPDSLAMLLLAAAAFPGEVEAATVDHGLRPESAEEAALAASNCAQLDVRHAVLEVSVPSGNVQAEARSVRYAALARWADDRGVRTILTAHHADDQAETFLMRANRGSGFAGLAGVRASGVIPGTNISLARPLLTWRRSALEAIALQSGLHVVQDPSNVDDRFDRVRIRKAMRDSDLINVDGFARSAELMSGLEADFDALVEEEWLRAKIEDNAPSRYHPFRRSNVHRPVFWGEVLCRVGSEFGAKLARKDAAQMVSELLAGRAVNIGGIQARNLGDDEEVVWGFAPENPRKTV